MEQDFVLLVVNTCVQLMLSDLKACREKRDSKKKGKAACVAAGKIKEEALAILKSRDINANANANSKKKFIGSELHNLLSSYGLEKKKHGKNVAEMRDNKL